MVNFAETALERYVAGDDGYFSWTLTASRSEEKHREFQIDLTSQRWRTAGEVDRPVWKHGLTIFRPADVLHRTAILVIQDGRHDNPEQPRIADRWVRFAERTQTVVAFLSMVPNQPLIFAGDGTPRVEDDLIACCWSKFLAEGDPIWLPQLPMVKSAVRAMDAVVALLASPTGGRTEIAKFILTGESKRGWTTWLAAAVDRRVSGIVPIVIDALNLSSSVRDQTQFYGEWSAALDDYVRHGITEQMGSDRFKEMLQIIDPYEYRHLLTMPKYVVNSSGDEYFLPDSSNFYFHELKGEKYLRYVPNSNHATAAELATEGIETFCHSLLTDTPRPQFSWEFPAPDCILLNTKPHSHALEVTLWQASNPERRDFRLAAGGPRFSGKPLHSASPETYLARIKKPSRGWSAFFVELVFRSQASVCYRFTTPLNVISAD